MVGLATKKVGVEPGLVPRLAGGGSAPAYHKSYVLNLKDILHCRESVDFTILTNSYKIKFRS